MSNSRGFSFLLKDKAKIIEKINQFTDIRKNPEIKLKDIITSVVLMPFYGITSLLGFDRLSRKEQFKKLFGSNRKMVASDSTIKRALMWLKEQEVETFQSSFLKLFEEENLSKIQLTEKGKYRRIGIMDGSQMGNHYVEVLTLLGKTDYPVMMVNSEKRGKELPSAKLLLKQAHEKLKESFPQLFLLDSLYFNKHTFHDIVTNHKSHLLIKSEDPTFREVLREAKLILDNKDKLDTQDIIETKGFDSKRWCSWWIEITSGDFAGYPVRIAHLTEYYPKRKKLQHSECWITTTDLSLFPEEIREAAHLRWHIENNVFKRLSHLTGTKRFYFKDSKPFFNMLKLFCAAIALFDILFNILQQDKEYFKSILDGIKLTWKNIFSQIEETLEPDIFI